MRIFVAPERLVAGDVAITGDEHHYLGRVRRARVGDAIELVDGAGRRAAGVIVRMTGDETVARVAEVVAGAPPVPHVRVLVPLIKGDRMDLCIEKLVEVGASAIVAWPAERSVVRLDPGKRDARLAHYADVAAAAARQSGAGVPDVAIAGSLREAVAALPAGARWVLDPGADPGAPVAPAAPGSPSDVTIAGGPEGGLAPAERDLLAAAGFAPLGLGPRILRAETAPVVAVALIRAATGS